MIFDRFLPVICGKSMSKPSNPPTDGKNALVWPLLADVTLGVFNASSTLTDGATVVVGVCNLKTASSKEENPP
uniref:Uncharacterized protein n=1 Tax=Romanomermis culicivorax TaxID=13658 RepID=A0A915L523_ROMCU